MEETVTISGKIEDIIYSNPENGYTVCAAKIDGRRVVGTVVGHMPYITVGEKITATGVWTMHPLYGEQFQASYCESVAPTDEDAILEYLSSGIVSGIRTATAKKLVKKFGADVFDVILNEPQRLTEIKGISKDRAKKISKSYSELQSMRSVVMFLHKYGIASKTAVRIYNALGAAAVDKIKENPYILAESVNGVSFKTSDTIAFNMGLPKNNPVRIRAGIKYILNNAAYTNGHTSLPRQLLIDDAVYKLTVEESEVEGAMNSMLDDKELRPDTINGENLIYLNKFFDEEFYIARRLCSIANTTQKFTMTPVQAEGSIDLCEKETGTVLAPEQRDAVVTALSTGCMVLTGGPGTGKTTVICTIIRLLQTLKLSVALAAPTGRAAKRMSQVTGLEAKTIHRLLGTKQSSNGEFQVFDHDENNPLKHDVIIVDEVSMIDVSLMASFLKAVKHGARVIFSGDADQLPSVGPGNVLRDIITSGTVPVIKLTKIFRQAEQSLIIVNAHKINRGELPNIRVHTSDFFFLRRKNAEVSAETITDLYALRLPQSYKINPISDIQVLSPTRKGMAGTENLNRLLQEFVNPPSKDKAEHQFGKFVYREGDKIMQTRNNYDIEYVSETEKSRGIFNGDQGIIKKIYTEDKYMLIVFDEDKEVKYPFTMLEDLEPAYAITVHKSQGSEFPMIIVPVCAFMPQLTTRNLFYTAVTRAKEMVILVGSERVITNMVANDRQNERYTGLCDKLRVMKKAYSLKKSDEQKNKCRTIIR